MFVLPAMDNNLKIHHHNIDHAADFTLFPPSLSPPLPSSPVASDTEIVAHNAKIATDKERKMTLREGVRLYPKAVAWSVFISTCIVMEGYDISLMTNFYAFSAFNRKYGDKLADGSYQVPARVGIFIIRAIIVVICCFDLISNINYSGNRP